MRRRFFMGGTAAALSMPAIIKFDSLMKLVVPSPLPPPSIVKVWYKGRMEMDAGLYYAPYEPLVKIWADEALEQINRNVVAQIQSSMMKVFIDDHLGT